LTRSTGQQKGAKMRGPKATSKVMTSVPDIKASIYSISIYPGSCHEFNISSRNVRDEVIKALHQRFDGNNIVKRLIEHMYKFHKNSLDGCSEFVIILTGLAHARFEFKTSRVDGEVIDYFLDKYDSNPPERFTKNQNGFFSFLGF
jgi:hypothetical protein